MQADPLLPILQAPSVSASVDPDMTSTSGEGQKCAFIPHSSSGSRLATATACTIVEDLEEAKPEQDVDDCYAIVSPFSSTHGSSRTSSTSRSSSGDEFDH